MPADRKWYGEWAVSQLMLETLRDLHQSWPDPPDIDLGLLKKQLKPT